MAKSIKISKNLTTFFGQAPEYASTSSKKKKEKEKKEKEKQTLNLPRNQFLHQYLQSKSNHYLPLWCVLEGSAYTPC